MKRYTCLISHRSNICWYSQAKDVIHSKFVLGVVHMDKKYMSFMYAADWVYDWEEKKYLKNRYYPSATSPPDIKLLETMYTTTFIGDENNHSQTLVLWEVEDSR